MTAHSSAPYIPALRLGWLTPFYDAVVRATTREREFKQALIAQAQVEPLHEVLDLGTGTGTLALWLKARHPMANVTGIDGDPKILALSADKATSCPVWVIENRCSRATSHFQKENLMKRLTLTAIAASIAFSFPAFAEDAHHPEKAAAAKPVSAQPVAAPVTKMQANVKKMSAQLDRVAKAKTPEERQQAMAEHMKTMHENMMTGKAMMMGEGMGCPMMKDGMMDKGGMGMMGGMPDGAAPASPVERMQTMEKRMDMMQMMMEQMMRRQEAGAAPAPMPMK